MNIKSYNKALSQQVKKALDFSFTKEMDPADEEVFYCCDTDTVKYKTIANHNRVSLQYTCVDIETIWKYCSEHLVKKYYAHFRIGLATHSHQRVLQIIVDNQNLTNIMKNYSVKEQTGITTGKKKFDAIFEFISKKMASIKRHFFSSPFEIMLQTAKHNHDHKDSRMLPNLSFFTKHDGKQKIWMAFEKNQFTVYYGISFQDRSEQQLCKIFLSELVDAKKHVHNSHSIFVTESELPKLLVQSFPQQKSKKYFFANGITSITVYGSLVKKPEPIATHLSGFRNYVYYHIQASKCYLHSRVLRRITTFHKDLTNAKIQSSQKN